MKIGSSSDQRQRGDDFIKLADRTIERGLTHVKIYKTTNKNKCDDDEDENNIPAMKEPVVDHTIKEEKQAPYVIVVHGPPKVGKSLLIKSLAKHYSGPDEAVVHLLGNRRRIQFVECPNNVNGMIDAAKYADAVIFLIDARYGFEMETFEFLNILRVHGIPKIIGVLTFIDGIGDDLKLSKTKHLKDQFFAEISEASNLFCFSGLDHGMYRKHELGKLANFILNMKFHHSLWRAQPYVLTKHFVDVTPEESVNRDEKCDRHIHLYGYLRGCDIKKENKVHIAGVGDFPLFDVTSFPDPFPLPAGTCKRRRFQDSERFEIEGFRTGTFLRLEVHNVPSEMVKNLNPHHPILVGFIGCKEENAGYMQVIFKPHEWHRKLLKSCDPIIVSVGWRRYQTIPTYAMEGCHGRLEKLDYTPKDKQCLAVFWGPLALPKTSIVIVQSLSDYEAAFRILATAVVLDCSHAANIFEKRRLIGTPCKILKKTALIQNMFTSGLQVDRYKDKKIRTKSGIRGKIIKVSKKRLVCRPKMEGPKGVLAKCIFESEIQMSDTVFMHVWNKVEVPRDFKPLMVASKPSDRIWKYLGPYDKVKHSCNPVYEVTEKEEEPKSENRQRLELLKKQLKERFLDERRKKLAAGKRETLELKRAVRIVEGEPSVQTTFKHQWTGSDF